MNSQSNAFKVFFCSIVLCSSSEFLTSRSPAEEDQTLNNAATSLLVPHKDWDCGMPDGIPAPESGTKVFEASLKLAESYHIGLTQYGDRWARVIENGTIQGEAIQGRVLFGALDFLLTLDNGVIEIEQIFNIKASDGTNIYMRCAGVGENESDVRIVCNFEAPNSSKYTWLHDDAYVARRNFDDEHELISLQVYRLASIPQSPANSQIVKIQKPEIAPRQSWKFRTADAGEVQGEQIISENVTLGPSLSVGPTKIGIRNTIPITGGTLTGEINGRVIPGGADYQQLSPPAVIDARYLWQTDDGQVIIVRNAGQFGRLVPTFEAAKEGKYAWLNEGHYLSSNPAMGQGGVKLKFFRSK